MQGNLANTNRYREQVGEERWTGENVEMPKQAIKKINKIYVSPVSA